MIKYHIKEKIKTSLLLIIVSLLLGGCMTSTLCQTGNELPDSDCHLIGKNKHLYDKMIRYVPCDKPITLSCQPFKLTDVRLLPQENVLSINAGDTARWLFQSVISNTDDFPINHVLIKPKEEDIQTNVIIATNQRTYQINLTSSKQSYSKNSIAFYDPDDNFCQSKINQKKYDAQYLIKLPFFEKIPAWVPDSIYNDGHATFIHIPQLNEQDAPVLYLVDEGESKLSNYTLKNQTYRVDQLFTQAILVQKAGRHQKKVTIFYTGQASNVENTKQDRRSYAQK